MEYFYACIWFGVGIYLLVKGIKEFKILCLFASYFIFLGFWWLANAFIPSVDLINDQPYANILRVISCIVVGFGIYLYIKTRNNRIKEENKK